jgi:hypothetical protein
MVEWSCGWDAVDTAVERVRELHAGGALRGDEEEERVIIDYQLYGWMYRTVWQN